MTAVTVVLTQRQVAVLIRAMAGVFLDEDADERIGVLRILAKANRA